MGSARRQRNSGSFSSSPVRVTTSKGILPRRWCQILIVGVIAASFLINAVTLYRFMGFQYGNQASGWSETDSLSPRTGTGGFSRAESMQQYSSFGINGATSEKMHGQLGIKSDGTPAWTPTPPPPTDLNIAAALAQGGGFNIKMSDSISLDRSAPDSRLPQCIERIYNLNELIPVSVVIVFHNEHFSTLMRSVHSVLNRTHPRLLHEIVLVDDGSTLNYIKEGGSNQLVEYIKYLPKVRLVRNATRIGIVGARLTGIKTAEAEIFAILDSHIEVQPYWLEPLITRIMEDRTRIVMPQIDGIEADSFKHTIGGIGCKVGFLWKLMEHSYEFHQMDKYKKANLDMSYDQTASETSPTMSGGLFAANKKFFFEVGAYDEGFVDWGAENLEFSFRVWMCGGRIECAPCSRVYHIFRRGGSGYSVSPGSLTNNKIRTLLWMDEYADLAYRVLGQPKSQTYGWKSLEDRRKWKAQRGCKSFRWYLHNVFPESDVLTLEDVPYLGELKNGGKCLDNFHNDNPDSGFVELQQCNGGRSQQFMYFKTLGHIMPVTNDEACITDSLKFGWCRAFLEQHFEYTSENLLKNKKTSLCIGASNDTLRAVDCDKDDPSQVWNWHGYRAPTEFVFP